MHAQPVPAVTLVVLEFVVLVFVVWCKWQQVTDKTRFIRDVNELERERWISKF
jgi:hypothetical protein